MNKKKHKFASMVWNPITGCCNDCEYCYTKKHASIFSGDIRYNLANCDYSVEEKNNVNLYVLNKPAMVQKSIYPFGFYPTFHKYRLSQYVPKKGGLTIYVGSASEMFGDWIPDEWIMEIFKICEKMNQHNYIFMTRNPKRYRELKEKGMLPNKPNFWYGTSMIKPTDDFFNDSELNTFISIEPLLETFEDYNQDLFVNCKWLILGADERKDKNAVIPNEKWVKKLIKEANQRKIPIFMNDNLNHFKSYVEKRPEAFIDYLGNKNKKKLYAYCSFCNKEKRKADMFSVAIRKTRGTSYIGVGFICEDCIDNFKDGLKIEV